MESMMGIGLGGYGMGVGFPFWMLSVLPFVILWSLIWKGFALWHSAQRGDKWWFIAFLVVNTVGILEIIYLFGFIKLKFDGLLSSKV